MPTREETAAAAIHEPPELIERILEAYGETLSRNKAAEIAKVPVWTVRKVLAQMPADFHQSLLMQDIYETGHEYLRIIRMKLILLPDREIGFLASQFKHLIEAGGVLEGGGKNLNKGIQNSINISKEEASRLRETIDAEVVNGGNGD